MTTGNIVLLLLLFLSRGLKQMEACDASQGSSGLDVSHKMGARRTVQSHVPSPRRFHGTNGPRNGRLGSIYRIGLGASMLTPD